MYKRQALGNSTAKTEGRRERRAKRDNSTSVRKKGADEANQTRRKRRREETKKKTRVPDRVKSFRELSSKHLETALSCLTAAIPSLSPNVDTNFINKNQVSFGIAFLPCVIFPLLLCFF